MSLPTVPLPVSGISMSLLQFDKIVRLSECGEIYDISYNPTFQQWDATAQCNVSLNDITKIFAFQSDHFDVNDISGSDIRFYVDNVNIPTLDLSSNLVYSGAVINVSQTNGVLTGSDMYVQKDYVRHLAEKLFNTAYGVDLFINEDALVQSVKDALQSAWSSCMTDLTNISIVGTNNNLVADANGEHKYLLHDAVDASGNSTFNICRELFKMMVSRASSRFTALPTLALDHASAEYLRIDPNANNLYRLPFVAGDQLVMRVVIKPCEHQPSFQNLAKDAEIQANERAYLLHLNLVA
jgi:hypothetical protein